MSIPAHQGFKVRKGAEGGGRTRTAPPPAPFRGWGWGRGFRTSPSEVGVARPGFANLANPPSPAASQQTRRSEPAKLGAENAA